MNIRDLVFKSNLSMATLTAQREIRDNDIDANIVDIMNFCNVLYDDNDTDIILTINGDGSITFHSKHTPDIEQSFNSLDINRIPGCDIILKGVNSPTDALTDVLVKTFCKAG